MNSEQKMVSVIARPISPSQMDIWFFGPTTVGRKTTAVVTVEAITAPETARAPVTAAAFAGIPRPCSLARWIRGPRWRRPPSRPMPSIMPIMDRTLRERPAK